MEVLVLKLTEKGKMTRSEGTILKTKLISTRSPIFFFRAAINVQVFFYNGKYGSFNNALNYPDGLAVLLVNILAVSSTKNY